MLAIAGSDGGVELWRTGNRPRGAARTESVHWSATTILDSLTVVGFDPQRCVALDSLGRVCLVFVARPNGPAAREGEGTLYFLHEATAGRPELVDEHVQANPSACRLLLDSADRPLVVYRQLTRDPEPDSGRVVVAERLGRGHWRRDEVAARDNFGFFPVVAVDHSRVSDVFHFNFNGFMWLHSNRTDAGWHTEPVGRQGDAMAMLGDATANRRAEFVFGTMRSDADPGPPVYASWERGWLVRDVLDPDADTAFALVRRPNGTLTALVSGPRADGKARCWLANQSDDGWRREEIPDDPQLIPATLAVDGRGEPSILSWDASKNDAYLWTRHDQSWTRTHVRTTWREPPLSITLRYDAHGRAVIVAASLDRAKSAIRVLRPKP